ncbi:hypothetical protein BRC93_09805 [Halobacteriales archaeon QS_5_70_15]|nr:MAG: hypothetical protein BRC93_09805 [Halobacteriales archaeon QS_5_70_15]
MGWVTYLGFLAVALACAAFARWYQPSVADQLARKTGVSGAKGWTVLTVASAWVFLPLLAGTTTTDGSDLWMFGAAIAGVGFYFGVMAVTSVDEYRLLDRARHVAPDRLTVGSGEEAVATSGTPSVETGSEGEARTPFTGLPAVHTDWILQRRERVGTRTVRKNIAGDVREVEFTLGDGAVAVDAGGHRGFSNAERISTFEPDEPLPDAAAEFLRARPDLPDPDERDSKLRAIGTYVPADEPVTVVGIPDQGEFPGQRLIDRAPPDELLGTDGAHATDGGRAQAVLIRGDADAAERTLRKRVYWLGIAAAVMILGGQALAFRLSEASLTAFL